MGQRSFFFFFSFFLFCFFLSGQQLLLGEWENQKIFLLILSSIFKPNKKKCVKIFSRPWTLVLFGHRLSQNQNPCIAENIVLLTSSFVLLIRNSEYRISGRWKWVSKNQMLNWSLLCRQTLRLSAAKSFPSFKSEVEGLSKNHRLTG